MFRILVFAENNTNTARLQSVLSPYGFACIVANGTGDVAGQVLEHAPHLTMIVAGSLEKARELSRQVKQARPLPVVALVPRETLSVFSGEPEVDDFALEPYDPKELALRINRLLQKALGVEAGELITSGDLILDKAKCEVTVGGQLIDLTFREYELLKFLVTHPGRVFSREALLDKVWGYEFYGGDRTVDVHVRRLRSKIESTDREFIETVRNIGYRFKEA